VTAVGIILLLTARAVAGVPAGERRHGWRAPVARGIVLLALVGSWPAVVRAVHARGFTSMFSPAGTWPGRAHATAAGMVPYLHVLLLAAPVAVVGGLVLSPVRRRIGAANDGWAWGGLAWGLIAVAGALVTGTGAIEPWIRSTVHRVTEFAALGGWWIVAVWAVVSAAAQTVGDEGSPPVAPGTARAEDHTDPSDADALRSGADDPVRIGTTVR